VGACGAGLLLALTAIPAAAQTVDTDGDGFGDFGEVGFEPGSSTGTDPLVFDTDGDGVGDGAEVAAGTDPTDASSGPADDGPAPPIDALPNTGAGPVDAAAGFLPAALAALTAAVAAGLLGTRKLVGKRQASSPPRSARLQPFGRRRSPCVEVLVRPRRIGTDLLVAVSHKRRICTPNRAVCWTPLRRRSPAQSYPDLSASEPRLSNDIALLASPSRL